MEINYTKFLKDLNNCTSEEAVKATYIKYVNFKAYIKEKVDLYVHPILFEFKYDIKDLIKNDKWNKTLAQAIIYVYRIQNGIINIPMPSHISIVDKNEAMLFPIGDEIKSLLNIKTFKWDNQASDPDKKLIDAIKKLEKIPNTSYNTTNKTELETYINDLSNLPSISSKKVISCKNFNEAFDTWKNTIGSFLTNIKNLGPYFVSDLREDAIYNDKKNILNFEFDDNKFQIPKKIYNSFWELFSRPPSAEVQTMILNQLHMFAPKCKRQREGAYYTPKLVASKAKEYIDKAYPGWEKDENIYIWDPCCGSGNLEEPLKDFSRIFMSTLDLSEVGMLQNLNIFPSANIFQFDFLNDGYIDLPEKLKEIIEDKTKQLIILMNPPYGEAAQIGEKENFKSSQSFTKTKEIMLESGFGAAANELFNQFIFKARIFCPTAHISIFAKLKYILSPNSINFSTSILHHNISNGFIVPATIFPDVKGEFPISFINWKYNSLETHTNNFKCKLDIYNKNMCKIGTKELKEIIRTLTYWNIERPSNGDIITPPLSGAITPYSGTVRLDTKTKESFGYLRIPGNDNVSFNQITFLSSVQGNANGLQITPDSFLKALITFTVRKIINPTWINDKDQFQVPTCDIENHTNSTNLPQEFINDCIIWALFSGANQTSTFETKYKEIDYKIDNQFYPFSKEETEEWTKENLVLNRQTKTTDNTFVNIWLKDKTLSPESISVLNSAKVLYKEFFAQLPNLMQEKYHLKYWNPGWYQIRMSLKDANLCEKEFDNFKTSFKNLSDKLIPTIYEYGFLINKEEYIKVKK